jgi:hypothetical protein
LELSEEMIMLLEVAEKVASERAHARQKGKDLSPSEKGEISGKATENVVRDHLMTKGFNISKTRVHISQLNMEIDLLLLKPKIDPMKLIYLPIEVDTVFEIKNNAVADQTTRTRANFDRLKTISLSLRFAFLVLSERITYPHRVTAERLGYPVFELISRRRSAGHWLESRDEIISEYTRVTRTGSRAMWETGHWNKLIEYLPEQKSEV